jgi:pSer/pThr/pTyr-binding forkhead associated (FHA) protein
MYSGCTSLEIHSPDGNFFTKQIEGECLTIGRSDENGLVLPDAEKNISRYHCILEYQNNCWWVIDKKPSANGTFLERGKSQTVEDVRKEGKFRLEDKDVILIPAKFIESASPVYWRLIFRERDSEKTNQIQQFQRPYLEYSLSGKKLWLVNSRAEKVNLRPQALSLIHYMAEKKRDGTNESVVCSYDELIQAIYGDNLDRANDLTRLVWEVRKKIESDPGEPEFLKTEGRRSYSLKVKLISED